MKVFRFEKLEVWQAARLLNRLIYRRTRTFPESEQFALTSQLRRASISISSNIAEGAGRNSDRDFAHFLEQAYGSAMEVASQIFLARDESYISSEESDELITRLHGIASQISALNRALKVSATKVRLPEGESDASRPSRQNSR
jgi:four helix bundle protein